MTAAKPCSGTTLRVGSNEHRVCKCPGHWWALVTATPQQVAS